MKIDKNHLIQAIEYEIDYHNRRDVKEKIKNPEYEKGFINGLEQALIIINGFMKDET